MIWDACEMYMKLTNEKPALFILYRLWFYMAHEEIFIVPKISPEMRIDPSDRGLFLKMLPKFEEQAYK